MNSIPVHHIEEVINDLRDMEATHRDKVSSILSFSSFHLAKANAYQDAAEMLEEQVS